MKLFCIDFEILENLRVKPFPFMVALILTEGQLVPYKAL